MPQALSLPKISVLCPRGRCSPAYRAFAPGVFCGQWGSCSPAQSRYSRPRMKPYLVARFLLLTGLSGFALHAQTTPTPPATPATSPVDQGLAALRAGQPATALGIFQQILTADPNNAVADLYASTAALEQYDGQLAVEYAEKARQLDPQSWKIHTTLVAAYASAGMKQKRDDERALLAKLHATGAPDARQASGFLLEMFQVGSLEVNAVQYFEPVGRFRTYYRFLVHDSATHASREIEIQSNEFDEKSWAAVHPAQAADGDRQFQITDAAGTRDYRTFSGKPDYDEIRAMIVNILQEKTP
jgi:tetratricopeptide (TPR) repeat protein